MVTGFQLKEGYRSQLLDQQVILRGARGGAGECAAQFGIEQVFVLGQIRQDEPA